MEYGLGWVPQLPDFRDYTVEHNEVAPLVAKAVQISEAALPTKVDLRQYCSPIEDQQSIGSCTAHAAVALVEYYERRTSKSYIDASRLFVYKTTRSLLGWKGDTGATLRAAMQSLVLFGAPPEQYWPYDTTKFEVEPTPFCYALASNYKATKYFRLDPVGQKPTETLTQIKKFCTAEQPCMFGFTVYKSLYGATAGIIPMPTTNDSVVGGHAICCVGYDDSKSSLLIRNSWGTSWGQQGYGWLPYDYILKGLATDFWAIQSENWVDLKVFR